MPRVALEIPESYQSVVRPVTYSVLKSLFQQTGIDPNTPIAFNGQSETAIASGSLFDSTDRSVDFGGNDSLTVECNELFFEDTILGTAVMEREYPPVWQDTALGINILPVYADTDVTFTIQYRCQNQSDAIRWRDGIRRRISMDKAENLHNLNYHYPLSVEWLAILKHLHELRENVAGYKEDFGTYLKAKSSPKLTVYRTLAGGDSTFVIQEEQVGVLGHFDFTVEPDLEQGNTIGTWIASFDYIVRYQKPISTVMNYPLMVHNQLISDRYRDTQVDYNSYLKSALPSNYTYHANGVLGDFETPNTAISGVTVPDFDEWIPEQFIRATSSLFRIMLQWDTKNPTFVLNLGELGERNFTPEILNYIKSQRKAVTMPYKSAIVIQLYEGTRALNWDSIVVDEGLNVNTTFTPDLRKEYHLRVALVNDLSMVDLKSTDQLRQQGIACTQLLQALDINLKEKGLLPVPNNAGYIFKGDYRKAVEAIRTTSHLYRGAIERRLLNVGAYTITV